MPYPDTAFFQYDSRLFIIIRANDETRSEHFDRNTTCLYYERPRRICGHVEVNFSRNLYFAPFAVKSLGKTYRRLGVEQHRTSVFEAELISTAPKHFKMQNIGAFRFVKNRQKFIDLNSIGGVNLFSVKENFKFFTISCA